MDDHDHLETVVSSNPIKEVSTKAQFMFWNCLLGTFCINNFFMSLSPVTPSDYA